jgi:predicted RND superfamily exporter protein
VIPADANLIAQYLLIYSGDLQSWLSPAHDKLRLSLSMKHVGTAESEQVSQFARDYFDPAFRQANHVRVEIAGEAHMYFVANQLMMEGLILSIVVCVVLVFLILLMVLKNLRMSLIAMTPIFATLLINFGALGLFNIPLNTVTAMVSSIAVGIGVDFSIHLITWYRGALRRNRNIVFALEDSILNKGRAIVFNMLVIVAGFLVLVVSNFVPLMHFGLLVSLCMVTTAVGALVLVPAMIRWLHTKERQWLYLD